MAVDETDKKTSLTTTNFKKTENKENLNSIKGIDSPFPTCVVGKNGKIVSANQFIDRVFLYDALEDMDFFGLTGVKLETLEEISIENTYVTIERNGCIFRLIARDTESDSYLVTFEDVTDLEELRLKYIENRNCMGRISIDNYEELQNRVSIEQRNQAINSIIALITEWSQEMKASLNRIKEDEFLLFFPFYKLEQAIENKFEILDKVRNVDTGADFPLSLSMGIGISADDMQETENLANSAIDLALGRGGDQAVVKTDDKTTYYGGKTQARERSNKGKSRIIAHALKVLISQSDQIFIMGHRNADMDAFGSSLGVFRICKLEDKDKDITIVVSTVNKSLRDIYLSLIHISEPTRRPG